MKYRFFWLAGLLFAALGALAQEPNVEITYTKTFDFATELAAPINQTTKIGEFTVTASGVVADAPIQITGANPGDFSVSLSSIPAGDGTYSVALFYKPRKIGKSTANLFFNFDETSAQLNQNFRISGCAYDPENLPSITIDPAEVELTAQPGETATATVHLTSANCFDYINGKIVDNKGQGRLTVNSTYFAPNTSGDIVVKFNPAREGEYSVAWEITTPKGNTVTLTARGTCVGAVPPEEKQGGELILSEADPAAYYLQTFEGVANNQPLDLPGWVNVAEKGTRAWWGFTGANGEMFNAAKATAYDLNIPSGTGVEAQMLLVSPALDYDGCTTKLLKFKLRGDFLSDDMTDELRVCLVELVGGEPKVYPMDGFAIPRTADESGTWIPYEVDMSGVADMPRVFFVGFRYTYTRDSGHAATYYVTDFEWGGTPAGLDLPLAVPTEGPVYNLQGVRVADSPASLPAGLYIRDGRKILLR